MPCTSFASIMLICCCIAAILQRTLSFADKVEALRGQISKLTAIYTQLQQDGSQEEADKLREELAKLSSDLNVAERSAKSEDRLKGRIDRKRAEFGDRFADERMDPRDPRMDREGIEHHRNRHSFNRQSKEEMEAEKHEKFHGLIKGRYEDMKTQINSLDFTADEKIELTREAEKFYRLELDVMDGRRSTSQDFEKARDIHDKEARRAHLDGVRNKRETERDGHMSKREEARSIRDKVMKAIDAKKRGVEL